MSENLNEMFEEVKVEPTVRGLSGTAQLTSQASGISRTILTKLNDKIDEYKEIFAESKINNNAMDSLIKEDPAFIDADVTWMLNITEDELVAMLKSQQSKRSRLKKKVMTMANYTSMMNGAIGELLIRRVLGKDKQALGRAIGRKEFTTEELEKFEANQEDLRREIRNTQSKLSIFKKNNPDDYEEQEYWISMQHCLDQLKSIRIEIPKTSRIWKKHLNKVVDKLVTEMTEGNKTKAELAELAETIKTLRETTQEEDFYALAAENPDWGVMTEDEETAEA